MGLNLNLNPSTHFIFRSLQHKYVFPLVNRAISVALAVPQPAELCSNRGKSANWKGSFRGPLILRNFYLSLSLMYDTFVYILFWKPAEITCFCRYGRHRLDRAWGVLGCRALNVIHRVFIRSLQSVFLCSRPTFVQCRSRVSVLFKFFFLLKTLVMQFDRGWNMILVLFCFFKA